jgi:hypothetical protein
MVIAEASPGAAAWRRAAADAGTALSRHATAAAVIDASRRLVLITYLPIRMIVRDHHPLHRQPPVSATELSIM